MIDAVSMAGTTGVHDVGGMSVDAAIDVASGHKKYQLWELQTHCLVTLLSKRGLLTVDEVCQSAGFDTTRRICLSTISGAYFVDIVNPSAVQLRRGVEGLPAPANEAMSYYERWAASVAAISMERGTIQQRDLDHYLGVSVEEPLAR